MAEKVARKRTVWDADTGFETVPWSSIELGPADAVWRPVKRGTTLRILQPVGAFSLALLAVATVTGDWRALAAILMALAIGLLASAWRLRYIGAREVVFADTWLGVRRRNEIDIVRYDRIGTIWASEGSAHPAWQRSPSLGRLVIVRVDGLPIDLPRLLTFTPRDCAGFLEFAGAQIAERSLPTRR